MKLKFLFLIIVLPLLSNAQKETAYWHFGERAGIHFINGTIQSLPNSLIETSEGAASISDINGNLLFYTDGTRVFDRNNNVMQNGQDLKGNPSSTQSAIIIPKPFSIGRYFIFTVDKPDYFLSENDPIEGVNFSEVDISLNNGNGGILPNQKNIHLITYDQSDLTEREYKSSEKISAVISDDCESYWVVTQFTNKFYSFRVSSAGVNRNPVISVVSNNAPPIINDLGVNVTAPGYMKISPDGKKLAIAFSSTSLGSPRTGGAKSNGKVFIYDFDNQTGKVSNEKLIMSNAYPYGVEFSPSSKKLYVTSGNYNDNGVMENSDLVQFDLESSNIASTKAIIHTSSNVAGALQLAMDGKIYRSGYPVFIDTHTALSVIHNPDVDAENVNYSHNSIQLSSGYVRLGLPPFVQSLFNNSFKTENLCIGSATQFEVSGPKNYDSLIWDFGDGATSYENSPTHIYSSPGIYTVSLTKIINGIPNEPGCIQITIAENPDLKPEYVISQCDIGDQDPTDGLTTFNLQDIASEINGGNDLTQLYFYKSKEEAMADPKNINGLNPIFRNSNPNQELIIKAVIFNTDCFGFSKLKLETTSTRTLSPSPIKGCATENGEGIFTTAVISNKIINELNLPENIQFDFFHSESDAINSQNPLPAQFNSRPATIYLKAKKDGECYGYGEITLNIAAFPDIENLQVIEACSQEFPITIGTEVNIQDSDKYDFYWNTGETGKVIHINQGGFYTLEVIDPDLGCGQHINFEVKEVSSPNITELKIENHGDTNTIEVIVDNTDISNIYFALDDEYGPYQNNPVFKNVPGGHHTIYAKDDMSCEISQKPVDLFGFPDFFTPNKDFYNDLWKPYETDDVTLKIRGINIFDRYGKLLKHLLPTEKGWDGNFNGRPMPSNDYWFEVFFINGRRFRGHFSLIR